MAHSASSNVDFIPAGEHSDRFAAFNITDATYKTVEGHNILCTIFTPKTPANGPRPVMVRWHGGFLITGDRMFQDWWPRWIIEYALHHSAILIAPDYRLLPEATGLDILSDISSFWSWLPKELPFILSSLQPKPLEADLSRVLVTGDSAGGWCAAQSFLSQTSESRNSVKIRAIAVAYGMLDMRRPWWTEAGEKHPFGAPTVPKSILEQHILKVKNGELPAIVSNGVPPERLPFCMATVQWGLFPELMGKETELYPMECLEKFEGEFPAMWLYHGKSDSAVLVEDTNAFSEKVREVQTKTSLLVTLTEGEHGFDNAPGEGMDSAWCKEGMSFITKEWLG